MHSDEVNTALYISILTSLHLPDASLALHAEDPFVHSFLSHTNKREELPLAHQIWTRPELVHIKLGLELPLCPALPGSNLLCTYLREFTALLSRGVIMNL